jgi:hypothetical protein
MAWIKVGSWQIAQKLTLLPTNFKSRLAIKISNIANLKSTWFVAGSLYQVVDIAPIGAVSIDKKISVLIRDSILFIPEAIQPTYKLKFEKVDWIDSLTISIYQDSMPLNFEPVINIPSTSASTATSTTVGLSTTSVSLLAANTNRKKLIISNNSNQDLYIDFDATASVADHSIRIPKVTGAGFIATYELEGFTGPVSGIWGAAGSGAALVREMV